MTAIATIKNPLYPKETLIFYCTKELHVGLNVQGEGSDPPQPLPGRGGDPGRSVASAEDKAKAASDNAPSTKGVIMNPSSFSAIRYNDLVLVCGISDNKLCFLSPGFRTLTEEPVPKSQVLATCGDGVYNAWLYCISNNPPELVEYSFSSSSATTLGLSPDANTYLCAYYENSNRYCIYQGARNSLNFVKIPGGNPNKIKNAGNAKPKTPMAVTNQGANAQLYYADSDNNLVRISCDAGGWKSPAIVEHAPSLADATQLAVVTSTDGKANFLYYIVHKGNGTYQRYIDKI